AGKYVEGYLWVGRANMGARLKLSYRATTTCRATRHDAEKKKTPPCGATRKVAPHGGFAFAAR
ncbi:hypothetical protein, partial [Caballeronia sp. NCF2]|uniref:hypothetical protein n=1 Tax=Caballeronia sp. NCF2 TaxID=2921754 RepID=UPI0020289CF7